MANMLTANAIVALNNGDVDLRPVLQVSVYELSIFPDLLCLQVLHWKIVYVKQAHLIGLRPSYDLRCYHF